MTDALYRVEGGLAYPTHWTAGPWSPQAQHGGPVGALLARAIEAVGDPEDLVVVRITIELQRSVPLAPLALSAAISRPGRRVDVVDAELHHDGALLARARALRIRQAPVQLPTTVIDAAPVPSTPTDPLDSEPQLAEPMGWPTFHLDAMEMRFAEGAWGTSGHAVVWQRLRIPVVEGEEPSPLQRAVAAADSSNGVSRVLNFDEYTFINPDLTVALSRLPVGQWVGIDARTRLNAEGWGQSESLLFDPIGPCGRAVQSLIVAPAEAPGT